MFFSLLISPEVATNSEIQKSYHAQNQSLLMELQLNATNADTCLYTIEKKCIFFSFFFGIFCTFIWKFS